ncbi:MAG: 4Fe-4S dicluster domain-containing protein [Chloroflexota bacterium]
MNLFTIAERLSAIDRSAVTLDAAHCLHARGRLSACEVCFDVCPTEAIQPGKPPTLNAEKCRTCLACLPVCPVGAYSADDAVPSLLNCAARLEGRLLELLCELHPSADEGISADSVGIRLRGCLAGLGSGAYLALVAMGIQRIIARTDVCEDCPWSSLEPRIQAQIAHSNQLLSAWGKDSVLSCITVLSEGQKRPLWEAENPPLSRRDLFQMVAKQGQVAIARAMTAEQITGERRPGRDRLRIIGAMSHLPECQGETGLLLDTGDYAILSVSEECSACAVCVRVCPTSALQMQQSNKEMHYRLQFNPRLCIGCELCVHVCLPKAMDVNHTPTYSQVFGVSDSVVLSEGKLIQCQNCNVLFATKSDGKYCTTCEYRRKNPFGSVIPPGVKTSLTHPGSEHDS